MTPHEKERNTSQQKTYKKHNTQGIKHSHHRRDENHNTSSTGSFSLTSRGFGFVSLEEKTTTDKPSVPAPDIFIPGRATKDALHGDTVEINITRKGARPEGEIVRVVKRAKESFVGTVVREDEKLVVRPINKRFPGVIHIPDIDTEEGMKVLVHIADWKRGHLTGTITQVIGKAGLHETEMQAIVLEKGIATTFPDDVEQEARMLKKEWSPLPESEIATRRDMRTTTTFTIDPISAKDFDDAISYKEMSNDRVEVGVHIADVAHFVREKTALDTEARKRAFSTYLIDRTIPMLPEILSNDLCSLNPRTDKLAFSAIFILEKKTGAIVDRWFGKTVINSNNRFSYEEAQEIIDAKEDTFFTELNTLNEIAHILRAKKVKNGAIEFGDDELSFELDEAGVPLRIIRKERFDAHRLVEEYMLLANKEVAHFFYAEYQKNKQHMLPFLYRIHDVPDPEKIQMLSLFVHALGHTLPLKKDGTVSAKDLNALFKQVDGNASEALIRTSAIRSMSKAVYATKNIGHFGLAFEYYTHFTSPIRRYADLLVHRILFMALSHTPVPKHLFNTFNTIAKETSARELEVVSAERESIKYKQVEYMSNHIGETFNAVISGVTDWGIYVEEKETKSEGLMRLEDLGVSGLSLNESAYALVNEAGEKIFTLGDPLKVILTGSNLESRQLDFKLV